MVLSDLGSVQDAKTKIAVARSLEDACFLPRRNACPAPVLLLNLGRGQRRTCLLLRRWCALQPGELLRNSGVICAPSEEVRFRIQRPVRRDGRDTREVLRQRISGLRPKTEGADAHQARRIALGLKKFLCRDNAPDLDDECDCGEQSQAHASADCPRRETPSSSPQM